MNFQVFKTAVAAQFGSMSKHNLFLTDATKEQLWTTYLSAFPEGTNPMFRERTEHDCNCCKSFIRTIGGVVSVVNGRIQTIWDIDISKQEPAYQAVADALAALVRASVIRDSFFHYESKIGTDRSFESMTAGAHTWDHFFVNFSKANVQKYVLRKDRIATRQSEIRSLVGVALRALNELQLDDIDAVLELIAQNSIYRGEEHKFALTEFRKLKKSFGEIPATMREAYVWSIVDAGTIPTSVLGIRNTAIGTLLVDLADGKDLEDAVKAFESKVAPHNYKRPTALVTKAMIERAKTTVAELGLTSALQRRYAMMSDITINNVLFANRATKSILSGDVFDELTGQVSTKLDKKTIAKIEQIGIDKFIKDVLPTASSVELYVENSHASSMVSLITAADPTAGQLFKWNNPFSWSYTGDVTDSIKERVKQAGGSVTGDVCCRLAWFNYDDLDFHMVEPDGYEIYFGNRSRLSPAGGQLDVDMNAGGGHSRTPVENIVYQNARKMKPGKYELRVHQFSKRESDGVGFEVEIDVMGDVYKFSYPQSVRAGANILVATLNVDASGSVTVEGQLTSTTTSRKVWGINTNTFVPVSMVMLSPNHWDGAGIGNKHWFFMLEGCQNEETARGFFNEFLKEELNPHRKVLEMVGSKVRTDESASQLSGVGFSSTKRGEVVVRVGGKTARMLKVTF